MTEYTALWDHRLGEHSVIARDDYENSWYVYATAPDAAGALEIADALNARERS